MRLTSIDSVSRLPSDRRSDADEEDEDAEVTGRRNGRVSLAGYDEDPEHQQRRSEKLREK